MTEQHLRAGVESVGAEHAAGGLQVHVAPGDGDRQRLGDELSAGVSAEVVLVSHAQNLSNCGGVQ